MHHLVMTYHRVTTSFEYVLVGIDLARAKPETAQTAVVNITAI